MIVIVFGLPGSGKSYFASRLAKVINANHINSDRVRQEIFKKRAYSDQEKKAVYDTMLEQMQESVRQKKNVVLDATFHKKDIRKMFVEEMKDKGGISFIEIQADENIIRERLKNPRPYSEADFKVYKFISQQNEPLNESHLILKSTDDNINEMIQKAAEYLKKNDNSTN
ncbi:AAA family ATPase [Agriterribacter sp.]|uniref:AAA family ATPase n=1 Tax=Agriterribacter sp. TaxID=2821509 RepID=UPI002C8FFC27|nr:AAA family ATPase [Agriterribacter sp.]HRO47550.1 AAA family ATPase [Agriterribacter sp.]HRQ16991.1 AAA family ATPase [Agriterribacter sp.]